MQPILVEQHLVDACFPLVAKHLDKAIRHNRCSSWTLPALYQACATRQAYLVIDDAANPKNALTFRFEQWDGETVCIIMFLGGEGGVNWAQAIEPIRQFCAELGVTRICGHLCDGWLRKFKTKRLATLCEIEV